MGDSFLPKTMLCHNSKDPWILNLNPVFQGLNEGIFGKIKRLNICLFNGLLVRFITFKYFDIWYVSLLFYSCPRSFNMSGGSEFRIGTKLVLRGYRVKKLTTACVLSISHSRFFQSISFTLLWLSEHWLPLQLSPHGGQWPQPAPEIPCCRSKPLERAGLVWNSIFKYLWKKFWLSLCLINYGWGESHIQIEKRNVIVN